MAASVPIGPPLPHVPLPRPPQDRALRNGLLARVAGDKLLLGDLEALLKAGATSFSHLFTVGGLCPGCAEQLQPRANWGGKLDCKGFKYPHVYRAGGWELRTKNRCGREIPEQIQVTL